MRYVIILILFFSQVILIGQYLYNNFIPIITQTAIEWMERTDNPVLFEDISNHLEVEKTTMSTMDAEFADLNNDGVKEIILATEFGPNRILKKINDKYIEVENERLEPLSKYKHPFYGEDSEDVALADFNLDGYLDLFFVSEDSAKHELYINNGDGTFRIGINQIPKVGDANAVLVHDFNNDKYPDILIGIRGQNELYINQEGESFRKQTEKFWPINTDSTQDIIAVDIDNDGDLDIVEGIENGGNNIYLNDNNVFRESNGRIPDMSMYETRKVVASDIDSDGDFDLFFCNVGWAGKDAQNRILLNNGKGFFDDVTNRILPKDNHTTLDALLVDCNNDGKIDIITHGINNINDLQFFLNIGTKNQPLFEKTNDNLPHNTSGGITITINKKSKGCEFYLGNYKTDDVLFKINGV